MDKLLQFFKLIGFIEYEHNKYSFNSDLSSYKIELIFTNNFNPVHLFLVDINRRNGLSLSDIMSSDEIIYELTQYSDIKIICRRNKIKKLLNA